jgi:isoleucyl-tRNA synthetase
MPKIVDFKSTLNLPHTDFPMKARLPEREPQQLADWENLHIYDQILESRSKAPLFVLHDGPPYPTGDIHLGTGLNKILKDLVVKSKTMAGFRSPYIPGWDCHGLPIETKVEKELGGDKSKVSPAEFRRRCREYATRFVDQNRRDFKRLGVFGQWEKPYLTMDPQYEACIAEAFLDFFEKGYVYRGLKPVYWCLFDRTALAEAEVEYHDHTSDSVWVKFPLFVVASTPGSSAPTSATAAKLGPGVSALIWTTTPWTLPANRALAFHVNLDYVVVDSAQGPLLLAADRVKPVGEELKLELGEPRWKGKGAELEGLKFQHPFLDYQVPAVLADYVTLDQGSGIVHTAPGHGADDFYTGQRYKLETYAPLDDEGRFTEGLPQYVGKTVFEANPVIIRILTDKNMLVGHSKYAHSYPHCWRCRHPVIFRATEQWFIGLDHKDLRGRSLEAIDRVKWTPAWGRERIHNMIAERPDWCISRQRFWGVPLIIFTCGGCKAILEDVSALRHVLPFFQREGADAWYTHSAEELLPPGTKCQKCGASKWQKENDILDVWFDSGSTNLAVLSIKDGTWPADVYLEGPDQYRGWFHSSLLVAMGVRDRAPYKQVVTHGWTLDPEGRPMSKSLGNGIYPAEVCEKYGADILRIWVTSQDYQSDMTGSDAILKQLSEVYRKLRNTFRFALSNLYDFDPVLNSVPDADLWDIDAWMLHRTAEVVRQCRDAYDAFEFHRVFHAIHDFAVVDLSAFYFDVLKDRLYTFAPNNRGRRSAQTAVCRIAHALLRLIAPILTFTSEEIWKHFPGAIGESIHTAHFPAASDLEAGLAESTRQDWDRLMQIRPDVFQALEEARKVKLISSGLEAKVSIRAKGVLYDRLVKYAKSLPAFFIVSQVELSPLEPTADPTETEEYKIEVRHADGSKCERCWNYSTHVGESAQYPTLCERCVAALDEISREPARPAATAPARSGS